MSMVRSLASGAVGAGVLTIIHEVVRRLDPHAPHVHVLGMRGIARLFSAAKEVPPDRQSLFDLAMVGDLVSNSLYYSLGATGPQRQRLLRGGLLGLLAGLGAVFLPGPLGLGEEPVRRSMATEVMTVAWYLIGGLVAGAASRWFAPSETVDPKL
jgi:hypothetical protein